MRSSNAPSVAVRVASTFPRLLILGFITTALVLTAQQIRLHQLSQAPATAPYFERLIDLSAPPTTHAPSVFENELAMSRRQLLDRWNPLIEAAAERFHVPANWIRAVMERESGGRTMLAEGLPIVSNAGAMGVMQLMPGTYGEMARQYRLGDDPFNPRDNIFAAAGYLRWLHGKYGFPAMFAAYNDGPGHFEDHLHGRALPAETRNYLKAIASELGSSAQRGSNKSLQLTRPDGSPVTIAAAAVSAVRPALPGEYDPSVHAVITMGHARQAVREDVALVTQSLRKHGVRV